MSTEEWRPIVGYEGLYLVSSFGNVKSVDRITKSKNQHGSIEFFNPGKVLAKITTHTGGYHCVVLSKDGRVKTLLLCRVVAEAFIPNPKNLPQVNHKNCIKTDNHVINLEWCTAIENIRHASLNGRMSVSRNHLNEDQRDEIRSNTGNRKKLAEKYNVSVQTIYNIKKSVTPKK